MNQVNQIKIRSDSMEKTWTAIELMLLEYGEEVKVEIEGGAKALNDPQQFITLTSGADPNELKNNLNYFIDLLNAKIENWKKGLEK